MNKKLLFTLLCAVVLGLQSIYAQCVINTGNTKDGFSPDSLPCITQNQAYSEVVQLHVPTTANVPGVPVALNVDSVLLLGVTGMPTGITPSGNPPSGIIKGGQNGCLVFSGTTSAAVGTYPLTFRVRAWVSYMGIGQSVDTTLNAMGYNYSLKVCQGSTQTQTCDTSFNISLTALALYKAPDTPANSGYLSGNNTFGDIAKAEKFARTPGVKVVAGVFGFGRAKDNTGNGTDSIWLKVWEAAGNGAPGTSAMDSVKVPLALLAAAVQAQSAIIVPFPKQPVSASGNFFIGFTLPTKTGDTVAILTDTVRANGPGRGWEQWSNGQWASYNASYFQQPSTAQIGNAIGAATCTGSVNPPGPVAAFAGTPLTGCGSLTTTFTDQSTGTPTSWSWTFSGGNPATSTSQNPTVTYSTPGIYNVKLVVRNANGADSLTKSGYVTIRQAVTGTATTTPATCGQANGGVVLTPAGGSGYTYSWSNSATTKDLTNVVAGVYTVTITASNGCSGTATASVANNTTLAASATATQTNAGASTGTATVTATGGTSPYTYSWSNGGNTATISNLAAGTYTVTVTDNTGCQAFAQATVTSKVVPVAAFTGSPLVGCGSVDVTFTDQSTGSPTSWAWFFVGGTPSTSTQQNPTVTFSGAGNYAVSLQVTNANGSDTLTKTGYIQVKALPSISLTTTAASCSQSNGGVTSTATGGNGNFTYLWSNGATTASLTNVAAGTYTVTVTSDNCTASAGATVNNQSTLAATTTTVPSTTSTSNNGTATVVATGGTTPYTYAWSNGGNTATISNLAPGTYVVTVTDNAGCKAFSSATVTFTIGLEDQVAEGLTFQVSPNPTSNTLRFEFGRAYEATGAVYGIDGKLFQTFNVNNQVEVIDLGELPAGVYIVQVKDKKSPAAAHSRVVKY